MKNIFQHISSKIIGGIAAVSLLFTIQSCDFGTTNVNPNSPTDAPMNVLLPAAQANLIYGIQGDISQFTACFTQHAGGVENIYLSISQYDLNGNLAARVWDRNLYPGAMKDFDLIIKKSFRENAPHYRGVARIMQANALGQIVDLWNNAPFADAFKGDAESPNFNPAYQTAEVLYDSVQVMLSAAIVDLQATTSTSSPRRDDLVFGGDRTRWIRTARALKARYFNHLSKVDPMGSAQRTLAEIDAGALTANAEDARIVFGTAQNTPTPWFAFLVGSFGNGIRMGQSFVNLLQSRTDPRLPFYARATAAGTFVGTPAGVSAPTASFPGAYFNRPESPANFITFAEVKFIEAEAALRLGNTQRAATAYNDGVRASVAKITAPIASASLATNAAANTTYFATYASETAGSITLEKIFTEKYIALCLDPESWNDWRRSVSASTPNGIPALTLAASSQQFTQGRFPRRWPYPISEVQTNGANVTAQGTSNTITDRVFWDR
jgi:hypothetical protein